MVWIESAFLVMQDWAAMKTPIRNFLTRIPNSHGSKLLCEVVAPLDKDPCDSVSQRFKFHVFWGGSSSLLQMFCLKCKQLPQFIATPFVPSSAYQGCSPRPTPPAEKRSAPPCPAPPRPAPQKASLALQKLTKPAGRDKAKLTVDYTDAHIWA